MGKSLVLKKKLQKPSSLQKRLSAKRLIYKKISYVLFLGFMVWVIGVWTEGSGLVGTIHIILLESAEVSFLTESYQLLMLFLFFLPKTRKGALNSPAFFPQQPDKLPTSNLGVLHAANKHGQWAAWFTAFSTYINQQLLSAVLGYWDFISYW